MQADTTTGSSAEESPAIVEALWGVRYQVKDISRSVAFYTEQLGFKLEMQSPPAFALVTIGDFKLILSGPGTSGARVQCLTAAPRSRAAGTGSCSEVSNLADRIEALKKAGLHFRNDMEVGPGGKQIQIEDPDGNPIELFEPSR